MGSLLGFARLVALTAAAQLACGSTPAPPPERTAMQITGTLALDGRPLGDTVLALVADDGHTLAVTRSDPAGRFALPAAPPRSWVIAKLRGPLIGGAAAQVATDGAPVHLAVTTADAATLAVDIELPAGAAPVDWFEVSVTPTALAGTPAAVLRTLTLDGVGPARSNAYEKLRVDRPAARLRVVPGSYDLRVAHVVDGPKRIPPVPASWVSGRATLADGRVVAADLEYVAIDVRGDTRVRVAMVPASE
jgi:hypothetical protein